MANQNLELALKIKALVEGAKNVQSLAGDVQKLQGQANTPLKDPTPQLRDGISKTSVAVSSLAKSMVGLASLAAIQQFVSRSVDEFTKLETAYRGLESVANFSGVGIGRAMEAATRLSADSLLTMGEASKALQNLLSRGYSIDEAVATLNRLKDAAAFGRVAHLSLGEAVVTASEGLKNENSILVDNAGVTKNVSVLWKEYADQIGKSVTELSQQEKVQAEVAGIMRETAAQTGNAAKAASGYQGQVAALNKETSTFMAAVGQHFIPILTQLTKIGIGVVQYVFVPMIKSVQLVTTQIAAMGQAVAIVFDAVVNRRLDGLGERLKANRDLALQSFNDIINAPFAATLTPSGDNGARRSPATTTTDKGGKAAAKAAAKAAEDLAAAQRALQIEMLEQAARLEQDDLARQIAANEQAYAAKLISAQDYYGALAAFQRMQGDSEIAALNAKRVALSAAGGSAADQVKTQAEILRIDTEIELVKRRVSQQQIDAVRQMIEAAKLQQDFIDGIEQEAFLSGLTNDERETALMLLEAEKLGITDVNRLLEAQGEIRANNNAKKAAEELQRQQDGLYESIQGGVQKAFADGLNAVATGGAADALRNVVDTIRNALSNALSGTLAEGFLGLLGGKEGVLGIAGSLGLGGKKDGSSAANALYVKDVNTAAAAMGQEGEAGGLFSGLTDMLGNLFDGLKSALSSLVSGIGSLFGGGGGGGGGLVSGIASLFGFADGGYTGPGGKYQPAGVVHAGEYVFSQAAVNRLGVPALSMLHRLASGLAAPTMPRWGYADGGAVNLPAAAPASAAAAQSLRMVLVDDQRNVGNYIQSSEGERVLVQTLRRNAMAIKQILR